MGSERAQREADHALFDSAHVVQLAVKFLMNLLCYFWIVFSVIQISDRNDGCFQIMGLQSSRYKEQMYNYWIIIWEDGKRFPPPRITRLKGKIRWDDDRTQYFSFPNIQWFVQLIPLTLLKWFSSQIKTSIGIMSSKTFMSSMEHPGLAFPWTALQW